MSNTVFQTQILLELQDVQLKKSQNSNADISKTIVLRHRVCFTKFVQKKM